MRRVLFLLTLALCFIPIALGQKVTNVRSEQQGNKIVVSYDLSAQANVSFSMTINGKKSPATRVSGDVGKRINKGIDRKIVWDVLAENPDGFNADSVVFTVKASPIWRTFVLAEGAISPTPLQGSGGIMIGRVARLGYYLKFRSSYTFAPSIDGVFSNSYITMDGYTMSCSPSDINKLITGTKKNTELICDVGAVINCSNRTDYPFFLYLGLGYGMRRQVWEFLGNTWFIYNPTSFEGVSVDLGMMFAIKNFLIDVGVNTINFRYGEIQFGLGWLFNK